VFEIDIEKIILIEFLLFIVMNHQDLNYIGMKTLQKKIDEIIQN
jgi:hypothetical protein